MSLSKIVSTEVKCTEPFPSVRLPCLYYKHITLVNNYSRASTFTIVMFIIQATVYGQRKGTLIEGEGQGTLIKGKALYG